MALQLDYFNKLIKITEPTIEVDAQSLHDFIEDEMASPTGMVSDGDNSSFLGDILKPEGKIEDDNNPGVFSQIILIINPEWQAQFWIGSGYSRIYGGKIVGGLNGQVMKATGGAGDITVLESQVDGVVVSSGSGLDTGQDDKLTEIFNSVEFIKGIEGGSWELVNDQMIFKDENNIEISRFDMFDKDGLPTTAGEIYKRVKV